MKIKANKKKWLLALSVGALSSTIIFGSISSTLKTNNNSVLNSDIQVTNINSRIDSSLNFPPKPDISYAPYKSPSEIVYEINKYAPNGVVTDEQEWDTSVFLDYFFNGGLSSLFTDNNNYNIKNLRAYGDSVLGKLSINFYITDANDNIVQLVQGSFTEANGLKKGITSIGKYYYEDATNNFETIKTKLSDPQTAKDYLADSGILINLNSFSNQESGYSTISLDMSPPNEANKTITINSITVNNAIGITNLENITFQGPIIIKPSGVMTQKETTYLVNYDYLNDNNFAPYNTAEKFAQYLNDSKSNIDTTKLITFKNPSIEPPTTATIVSATVVDQKVNVEFAITNYYDSYGSFQSGPNNITLSYTAFPINKNITTINTQNSLTTLGDYAYQYSQEDLKKIIEDDINGENAIVKHPVLNSKATISDFDVNNKNGMISATITLSEIFDENGNQVPGTNKPFRNILFKVKKNIDKPTYISRNDNPITETIRDIDEIVKNKDPQRMQEFGQKYIKIENGVTTQPATEFIVKDIVKVSPSTYASSNVEQAAEYKIIAKLKNYIKNDEKFTYVNSESQNDFIVYVNVLMNKATKLLDEVASAGIDADTTIENLTVNDLLSPSLNNNLNVLKDWIVTKTNDNKIFENYKNNMSQSSIADLTTTSIASEPNSIQVNITLNDAYQFNGTTTSKQFTFKINNLGKNIWTVEKQQVVIDAKTIGFGIDKNFASSYANSANLVDVISNEIKAKPIDYYFDNLPNLEPIDKILQVGSPIIDDKNGKIIVTYKLPKFYVKGVLETPTNPENNTNAIIYEAVIKGFKREIDNPFSQMDKNINANQNQLNDSINNSPNGFKLVSAFKYKDEIKRRINTFLSSTESMPKEKIDVLKGEMKNFDKNAIFGELIISPSAKTIDSVTATVKVKYPKLAELSGDENWIVGYDFNILNAKYANTSVATFSTTNSELTINDYKKLSNNNEKLSALNTTIDFLDQEIFNSNNYNDPVNLDISFLSEDVITGKAVIKLTFPKYFIENKRIDNYEYTFNFNFKPDFDIESNDYIVNDPITGTQLVAEWNGTTKTISAIYAEINNGTINMQEIINNKKGIILNPDFVNSNLVLTYKNVALSTVDSDIYLLVNIGVKIDSNDQTEVIEQLKVGPFNFNMSATNPTQVSNPNGATFDVVSSWEDNSHMAKGDYIDWVAGKTPTTNEDIQIIASKLDTAKKTDKYQIAFIDFTFNGVYLKDRDIKSFVSNYVVKLKMDFSLSGLLLNSEIVWSGTNDQYISANYIDYDNNNWIICTIISLLIVSLIATYAIRTLYTKIKENKAKKGDY